MELLDDGHAPNRAGVIRGGRGGELHVERASGTGNGSYQVTDKSSATVKVSFKGTTAQGMPITYESTSVHKWIGSDCSAPPPGVDPSVAELLQ
ncbi:hypothetical protein [Roseateles sp.]|uniref:hypothetical protein n=1 Tax=Roseateles sp. TaxID=1971397 RepID=UPI0031DCD6E1